MRYGNYDAWKLATPWDNEPDLPEIYKTEKYEFFTEDEKLALEFDRKMVKLEMSKVPEIYDTKEEYFQELAENLADDLGLEHSEQRVLEVLAENERAEYEYAMEQRAEHRMEMRRLRGSKYE